jgi:hypothetical protein
MEKRLRFLPFFLLYLKIEALMSLSCFLLLSYWNHFPSVDASLSVRHQFDLCRYAQQKRVFLFVSLQLLVLLEAIGQVLLMF